MNETALEILTHKPVKPAEVSLHVKNITNIVCSPNMKYIATWCPGNKLDILPSIYRWPITKGKLKFDKHYIIYDSINLDAKALIGVSDMNHIILRVEDFVKDSYNFEIIDIVNNKRQKLNSQGLKGKVIKHSGFFDKSYSEFCNEISFLENGDLAIIKDRPVYRAYIFNFNEKHQWKCKCSIELPTYYKCSVSPKGKLLVLLRLPFVIMQWDLITLKYEMRYVLDWNLYNSRKRLQMCLNNDNSLLSVGETKIRTGHGDYYKKPAQISIYSVKDGLLVNKSIDNLNDPWNQGLLLLDNMRFIGSETEERLLFSFYIDGTDQRQFSIMNPHNLTNPIDAKELFKSEIENY